LRRKQLNKRKSLLEEHDADIFVLPAGFRKLLEGMAARLALSLKIKDWVLQSGAAVVAIQK
jgi:hypothetical protein